MKIGILEVGRLPDELQAEHGDYPTMVANWLAPLNAEYQTYPVLDGVLPDSPDECDLWVIPGSKFGVYEEHDWIAPAQEFIRACRGAGKKMIGICFGHQLIAQALGGTVVKSDKGWGLGVHEYSPINWPDRLGEAPGHIAMQAFHQDQVIVPPKGVKRVATSDFCENAALWYPDFAFTVQGHPEFPAPYTRDLLASRRGSVLPEETVDAALDKVDAPTTRDALALFVRDNLDSI